MFLLIHGEWVSTNDDMMTVRSPRWWQLKDFWMFHPYLPGEDAPILTSIFFRWVGEKPPTSLLSSHQNFHNFRGQSSVEDIPFQPTLLLPFLTTTCCAVFARAHWLCLALCRRGWVCKRPENRKQTDRFWKSDQLGPLVIAFI